MSVASICPAAARVRRALIRPAPAPGLALLFALAFPPAAAQEPVPTAPQTPAEPLARGEALQTLPPFEPYIAPASDEARLAIARFRLEEGWVAELFAAEPLLANPVCLWVTPRGDVLVAETFRHHEGVTDVRNHLDWLDEDLSCRTVDDRVAMLARHAGENLEAQYGRASERIRLVRDTDGDGVADEGVVFAEGFDDVADGIGAGLLEYEGDVYYACIPSLWRLRDTDGDGRADERTALSTGYGVHVSLLGHDLHGLRLGPDGRLYFSCGDRGFHVETANGVLDHPDTGGVLRCELDGSGLEVFATGLRNPQELVFDERGDLFTGDNNSDGGDEARFVLVVEGADCGWRTAFQFADRKGLRGPWNDEQLWKPWFPGQAAYIVPPIANIGNGPSGLTRDPGTGLPQHLRGRFFLCDFRADPATSGIHAIELVPQGASWALGEVRWLLRGALPTDCDFGPDGALYFTDWVEGWDKTGKGRIYRLFDPDVRASAAVRETRAVLEQGFAGRSNEELRRLLEHADQRVRLGAELALAHRGEEGRAQLLDAALRGGTPLARLHGVWGLGILARRDPAALAGIEPLFEDDDPEVRAQLARVLGDTGPTEAAKIWLHQHLDDESPRVRREVALALGRLGEPISVGPLVGFLRRIKESERVLFHAACRALARCARDEELAALAADPSRTVRLGAVVALRRRRSGALERFLSDADPAVVLEAARAIHDLPIEPALPALAALTERTTIESKALARRVLNARFRLGREEDARALFAFARRADLEPAWREEALEMLALWAAPPGRDLVTGQWRPLVQRDGAIAAELCRELFAGPLEGAPLEVRRAAVRLAAATGAPVAAPLLAWVRDAAAEREVRGAAIEALARLEAPEWREALAAALADRDESVRAAALATLEGEHRGALGDSLVPLLARIVREGGPSERRVAYRLLAREPGPQAEALLAEEARRLDAGLVPPEVALDLVTAIEVRRSPSLSALLAEREARRRAVDPELALWLDSLYGGNAARGRRLFREKQDLGCLRCHRVGDEGTSEVGPDLAGVGDRLTRLQLLEEILAPNRRVVPGYAGTNLLLHDGTVVGGRIVAEDEQRVFVLTAEGERIELDRARIAERRDGLSAMPEGLGQLLTREQMRDLLEYLASLRDGRKR